jgi:hypothetical protein
MLENIYTIELRMKLRRDEMEREWRAAKLRAAACDRRGTAREAIAAGFVRVGLMLDGNAARRVVALQG